MGIAKPHPAAGFGWLHVEGADAQAALMERQRLVAIAEAADRNASGEPEGFNAWSCDQIRRLAKQPRIAKQLRHRLEAMESQRAAVEAEHTRALVRYANERDRIASEAALLNDFLAASD